MLSRSARASRICFQCQLALHQRRAAQSVIGYSGKDRRHQLRSYSTGPQRTNKAAIEALIRSGSKDIEENIYLPSTETAKEGLQHQLPESTATEATTVHDTEPDFLADGVAESGAKKPPGNDVTPENPFGQSTNSANRKAFKHELLSHQDLGVDSLGEPVEALIIKNPNKLKAPKKAAILISEDSEITVSDLRWQDAMPKSELVDDTSAEVLANLEELRPADTDTISQREYDARMATLVDGFTSSQLVWYISKNQDALQQVDDTPAYPCVLRQSRWESATKDPWDKMKPKQQLASTIMRSIWRLYKQEEVEGFGRVRVWLPSDTLRLLAQSGRPTLVSIRDDFLDPISGEKLSIALDDDRLTIYSKRSSVSPILERLQDYAEDVAFRDIPLEGIMDDQLQPHVLKELEKVTDTVIQLDKKTRKMTVSWKAASDAPIPSDKVPRVTPEDPGEIVWRLLVEKTDRAPDSNLQIIKPGNKKSTCALVEHHREIRSMSWRDKLRQWTRYVQPLGKKSTGSQPLKLASKVQIPKPPPEVAANGGETVLTADFGHILHLTKDLKQVRAVANRRILSPTTPHPAGLTSITTQVEDAPIIQHTAIILNFSPASYFQADPGWYLPEVRLRLPIDPETDISNFMFPQDSTLYTITPSYSNDILLPAESVDIRLTQNHLYPLDMKQQSLWDFITLSKFALLEGYLKTPHTASFTIPVHCVSGQVTPHTLEDVPYMFMGLEIHQTTNMEYKGQTLRYNSIEAGQHGGQRQELSLLPGPPSSTNTTLHKNVSHDTESFLNVVEEIANGGALAWNNGAEHMESRSQERFTQDLLDETYEMQLQDGSPEEAALDERRTTTRSEETGERN